MAAKGIPLPWRWDCGTISTKLDVIWGMSDKLSLKGEFATSVLDNFLSSSQGQQVKGDDSVSFALLLALMFKYPCASDGELK